MIKKKHIMIIFSFRFSDLGGSDPGVRTEIMRDLMRVEAELAEAELRRRQQLSSSVSLTMEESTCQSPPLQAYQSPTQASQTPPLQDSSSVPSSQGHQSRSRNCIELKQINEQVCKNKTDVRSCLRCDEADVGSGGIG